MPVGIALAYLAVASVDEQLCSFTSSGLPCGANRGGLRTVMGEIPLSAFLSYSPLAVPGYHVYISFHLI
jgi:hypothetical protein